MVNPILPGITVLATVFADDAPLVRQPEAVYAGLVVAAAAIFVATCPDCYGFGLGGGMLALVLILALQPLVFREVASDGD